MDIDTIAQSLTDVLGSDTPRDRTAASKLVRTLTDDALTPLRDALGEVMGALDEADGCADDLGGAGSDERDEAHENLTTALSALRDELVGIGLIPAIDRAAAG